MKHFLTYFVDRVMRPAGLALLAFSLIGLATDGAGASTLRRSAIVRAVAAAKPSVVNIHGHKTVGGDDAGGRKVNGMGTGVVIDERGYVVTNHHVVDGVREIKVTLADGQSHIARLVAHDPATDLAIIKISTTNKLPLIRIGTSADLMEGEEVIAVGNAYGYEHTVTRGIISALHRTVQVTDTQQYEDLIQTDASINPGNSGGPLLNIDGEMIGINVAVRVGAQGIGFAIPVDRAMDVAARLLSAERASAVWHGIIPESARQGETAAVTARSIQRDSPAQSAGISEGDMIVRVNSLRVERMLDLERAMIGRAPGDEVEFEVQRQGQSRQVRLRLAASPTREVQRVAGHPAFEQAWSRLGMRLENLPQDEFPRAESNGQFRGGLRIVEVNPQGPAAQQGVMAGDILVGVHQWATTSANDLAYVFRSNRIAPDQQVRFYILRGTNTLFGQVTGSVLR